MIMFTRLFFTLPVRHLSLLFLLPVLALPAGDLRAAEPAAYRIGFGAPDPLFMQDIVGPDGRGLFVGPGEPAGGFKPVVAAANGATPAGVTALPRDLFTSDDFYRDSDLWQDPRYFRCNSPMALEAQWGATQTPVIGDNPPQSAAWGYCDRDYPRDQIVSPYPFDTARAHYDSLLANARAHGGPDDYDAAHLPDWNGRYRRRHDKRSSWYDGAVLQIPTYLSLLTPDYQRYFVQQMYHYGNTNAAQWPGQYCWPEGFMRRFSHYGGITSHIMVTPDLVQEMRWGATNMVTHITLDRAFDLTGPTPRLGADVPRWYGETIGFWDGDILVTWTANVQGWISHGSFEFSNSMQSIEIYSPVEDAGGHFTGLRHEAILYDPQALVEPVRIVHYLDKVRDLNEGDPYEFSQCVRTIFPVDGIATQLTPGQTIDYTQPDMYHRPWAQIWERHFEQDMERPRDEDLFQF